MELLLEVQVCVGKSTYNFTKTKLTRLLKKKKE